MSSIRAANLRRSRRCRKCGCTEANACVHKKTGTTCRWIEFDLCSACWNPKIRRAYRRPVKVRTI